MNGDATRFVRLSYTPASRLKRGPGIILLVFQQYDGLGIAIPPGWERGLSALDREYLAELMSDWKRVGAAETEITLDQLAELSIGPLGMIDSGIADRDRLSGMIQEIRDGGVISP